MEYKSKVKLSIRRIEGTSLPGEDSTLGNVKVGASLKGTSPLRGLTYEEEIRYLPQIVGYSPKDQDWRKVTKEYWNNISVPIPADGTTADELQGRVLEFVVGFSSEGLKKQFDGALEFEHKVAVIEKAEKLGIEKGKPMVDILVGVNDYVLFRYCLVYGRVANTVKDIRKSPKIRFYLHSKENATRYAHKSFKARKDAMAKFIEILDNEKAINALLLLFKQNLGSFNSLEDKHLALEVFVNKSPAQFLTYMNDSALLIKALIVRGVEQGVINNPANTDSYYYGENNEVLLGSSLTNAVLYFKSPDKESQEVVTAIKAQIDNN